MLFLFFHLFQLLLLDINFSGAGCVYLCCVPVKESIKTKQQLYFYHLLVTFTMIRNTEDRSAAANGSGDSSRGVSRSAVVGKGSPHSSEKFDKKMRKDDKTTNGSTITRADSAATTTPVQSEQETRAGVVAAAAAGTSNTVVSVSFAEKVNAEVIEWPKIYVALSRKEKEDDFLAMKGTKLPHRPKKRAKNIDRTLQVTTQ